MNRSKATDVIDLSYKVKGVKLDLRPNVFVLPTYAPVAKHPFPLHTVTTAPTQSKNARRESLLVQLGARIHSQQRDLRNHICQPRQLAC